MRTLLIRLPTRALYDGMVIPDCYFALIAENGDIVREGCDVLANLASLMATAATVTLIIAAADVTLLHLQVPPLNEAKLKMALPHLVEEQLLGDVADCMIVVNRRKRHQLDNTHRLIAVVLRNWLELLVKTVRTLGARKLQVWPAQLCLKIPEEKTVVAVLTDDGRTVALRAAEEQGLGWSAATGQDMVDGIVALFPEHRIDLYVPPSSMAYYQQHCSATVTVLADTWPNWVAGMQGPCAVDLMSGLTARAAGNEFRWQRWRWPVRWALAILAVNIIGLNLDWWHMRQEASMLRRTMTQNYRSAFPKDTVIVDPIAQAKQKITLAERAGGQLATDDFISLASAFSTIWAALSKENNAIASIEYRDHALLVRLKDSAQAQAVETQVQEALAQVHLTLKRTTGGVWQIGE